MAGMTMCMAIVQGEAAHIYADTAYVRADGCVDRFDHKLIAGSRFPWVMAHNLPWPPNCVRTPFDIEPRNIAELVAKLLPAVEAYTKVSIEQNAPERVRLVVAAWDKHRKLPRIFVAAHGAETASHSAHCPPGIGEARYFVGASAAAQPEVSQIWRGGSPNDPKYFHPVFDAAQAFEIERAKAPSMFSASPPGGTLEMATVTRKGVTGTRIYRWADRVGAPVNCNQTARQSPELAPALS